MKTSKNEKDFNDIDFASTIYNIRIERKLTQKQLAEIIGVSDRTVSKWEQGDTVPDLYSIRNICNKLDVSPSSIVKSKRTVTDWINSLKRTSLKACNYLVKNIIIICFAISFLFLFIYFINNYNMVNVYNIKYTGDNIKIKHSYFIKTKANSLLAINKITLDKIKFTPTNIRLELYTYYYGDKYIIYEANSLDDIYIEEAKNRKDILTNDVINSMKNSLYLDVYATNELNEEIKYSSKLILEKELSNNKLAYNKATLNDKYDNKYLSFLNININKDYSMDNLDINNTFKSDNTCNDDEANPLKELGYKYDSKRKVFYKNMNNYKLEYSEKTKIFKAIYINNDSCLEILYYTEGNKLDIKEIKDNNIVYARLLLNSKRKCLSGPCSIYKNEINNILNEYAVLFSSLK